MLLSATNNKGVRKRNISCGLPHISFICHARIKSSTREQWLWIIRIHTDVHVHSAAVCAWQFSHTLLSSNQQSFQIIARIIMWLPVVTPHTTNQRTTNNSNSDINLNWVHYSHPSKPSLTRDSPWEFLPTQKVCLRSVSFRRGYETSASHSDSHTPALILGGLYIDWG